MAGCHVLVLAILAVHRACAHPEPSAQGSKPSILGLPSPFSFIDNVPSVPADLLIPQKTLNNTEAAFKNPIAENGDIVKQVMSVVTGFTGSMPTDSINSTASQVSAAKDDIVIKDNDMQTSNASLVRRKRTFKKKKKGCKSVLCRMLSPMMGCGMRGCGQPSYQPPPCGHPMSPCGGGRPPMYHPQPVYYPPPRPPPQPVYHQPPPTCDPCRQRQPVYHPPPPPPPPQPCHSCQQGYQAPTGGSFSQSSSSSQSSAYSWGKK